MCNEILVMKSYCRSNASTSELFYVTSLVQDAPCPLTWVPTLLFLFLQQLYW